MLTGRQRPFTVTYWTVSIVVLVGGWVASRFLVPGVIESAYAGQSFGFLNSIIRAQAEIPLSGYLTAWSQLATRLLVGAGLAAAAGYAVVIWYGRLRGLARRLLLESDPRRTVPSAFVYLGVFVGLTAGAVEAIAVLLRVAYLPMLYSREVLWMAPVMGAMVFGALGIVFALITLRWPAFPRLEAAVLALSAVAAYGVLRPVFSSVHPLAAVVLALGIGVQVVRVSGRRAGKPRPRLRRWTGGLAGLVVAVALFHHGSGWVSERRSLATLAQSREGAPNILLLILDTVRAKNMSLYGYGRLTTPVLDALATRAVVFDRALAPTSWTLPSHGTFFTGRWPSELNVDFEIPLDDSYPTLAEFFTRHGYVSVGFVANYLYATEYFGLNRGFLHYDDEPVSWPMLVHNTWLTRTLASTIRTRLGLHEQANRKSAAQVNEDFLAWRSTAPERPYFAFLNYIDAHEPYRPPPPFRNAFSDGDGQYWHTAAYPDGVAEELQAAYDAGIAYIDRQIGMLLAELERRGELDNTVVIVTSDHGEEFGEHGLFGHDQTLYLTSIRVPLLVRLPSEASGGTRVARPVTLRDLPATIVDVAGLGESAPFPGTSLRGQWDQDQVASADSASPVFTHLNPLNPLLPDERNPLRSVLVGDKHYIAWEDGREELYDIATDPAEQHDLSDSLATDLQELRKILATFP